jgi:hypothetical protein
MQEFQSRVKITGDPAPACATASLEVDILTASAGHR